MGERPTLADVLAFAPLVRFDAVYNPLFRASRKQLFDAVYNPLFRASRKQLLDYPHLAGMVRRFYGIQNAASFQRLLR